MFQPAVVVVNDGLVQFPWDCVGPISTRAGPAAADDAGADVVVVPPAMVVVVDPLAAPVLPLAAVVVVDPDVAADVVVVAPDEASLGKV